MKVLVISPERIVFDGDADSVTAPAVDGELGILAHHAPLIALLGRGDVRLGDGRRFAVEGGFLQVAEDVVRVVTESATESNAAR
jgi:F-type H+-transporting ATPase subunit epsilon